MAILSAPTVWLPWGRKISVCEALRELAGWLARAAHEVVD